MRVGPCCLAATWIVAAGCGRPSPIVASDGRLEIVIAGTGEVSSVGSAAIDCGTDCTSTIEIGAEVELVATAGPTRALGGWDGPCAGAAESCTFTFTGDTTLEARFGFPLTVATTGAGTGVVTADSGVLDCGSICTEVYDEGAFVTLLTAPLSDSSAFGRWLGACTSGSACVVEMDGPKDVTARFDARGRALAAWTWGDVNDDSVWQLDIDTTSGDLLVCGFYDGLVDFDGTGAVDSRGRDGFVLRRTADGDPVWKRILRDPDNDATDEVRACVFDGGNGVTVSGQRDSNNGSGGDYDVTGDTTPEVTGLATNGDTTDGFVARFDGNGTFDWISSTTGLQQSPDNGDSVTALAAGGNEVWGGGDIPGANNNGYIQRYTANSATPQTPVNEVQVGGTNSQGMEVRAMVRGANGDLFFTGYFDTQITWGTEVLTSGAGSRDIVVASGTATTAAPRWLVGLGGNQNDEAEAIAIDTTLGRIAVTGQLDNDVFVAVFALDGNLEHFRRFDGPGADAGRGIAWLPDGGFVLAGEVSDAADLGLGLIATRGVDAFVARFDAAFQPVWAHRYGGDQSDQLRALAVAPDGSIWAGGDFRGVMDTEGDPGTLTSNGGTDAWIVRVLP